MTFLLIILFTTTLIYLALAEQVRQFVRLLIIQGVLLFGIAYYQLKHIDLTYLFLILLETLIVKSVATPLFLNYVRRRNKLNRLSKSKVPTFVSILIICMALIFSFTLSNYLHDIQIQTMFFAVAISTVITGIYFIITQRSVFAHLIGYLVIENGIFMMSLAVGQEMTMLVQYAILLDIFISIMALGIFINKLSETFQNIDIDNLSQLKE